MLSSHQNRLIRADGQRVHLVFLPARWHVQSLFGQHDRFVSPSYPENDPSSFRQDYWTRRHSWRVLYIGSIRSTTYRSCCSMYAVAIPPGDRNHVTTAIDYSTIDRFDLIHVSVGIRVQLRSIACRCVLRTSAVPNFTDFQVLLIRVKRLRLVFVPKRTVCRRSPLLAFWLK